MKIERELTPKPMRCAAGIGCPAIFETDKNSYLLIGRQLSKKEAGKLEIDHRIAAHETVIEIPKKLLKK